MSKHTEKYIFNFGNRIVLGKYNIEQHEKVIVFDIYSRNIEGILFINDLQFSSQ